MVVLKTPLLADESVILFVSLISMFWFSVSFTSTSASAASVFFEVACISVCSCSVNSAIARSICICPISIGTGATSTGRFSPPMGIICSFSRVRSLLSSRTLDRLSNASTASMSISSSELKGSTLNVSFI